MPDKKKIIFVHSYFYPDHSAGSQMLSDLVFYLAENRFKVSVVTSRKKYGETYESLPVNEVIDRVNVYREWSSSFGRTSLIGRTVDYLSLELSLLFRIFILTKKGDIVVFMTDPPLLNALSFYVLSLKKIVMVNWLQDLFPEVAIGAGLISNNSWVSKWLFKVRNKCLNGYVMNVVIGRSMHDYLVSIGIKKEKIIQIPNWSDGKVIKPIPNEDNYIRKQWGLSKEFVVGYSGNLGNAHDISTILLAAELLKDHEEICFLFIGGGVGMAELKKQFEKRDIRNVVFKPYQSRDLLDLSLSVADIHWMTLEPQMEGFIVPSKFYGILAVGRPIIFIGDTSGDIAKEIERVGCGVSIEVGNVKALVEKINNFYVNDEIVYSMGQCGRKEFESMYDMPISLDKFKVMFKKMSETSV